MKKRGQATIFIIIAVVIIAGALAFIFLNQSSSTTNFENVFSQLGITSQAAVVESSILECLDITAKDAIVIIGIQGGYHNKPQKSSDIGFAFIPFYYDKGEFLKPSTATIENELASYIDDSFAFCIDNLLFENFDLNYKSSGSTAKIRPGEVSFTSDLSIIINKDGAIEQLKLENHPITIESSMFEVLEVATFITESHKEDAETICVSCVADMAEERDLFVDFVNFGGEDSTTLVVISEDITGEDPFIFEFLNKYPAEAIVASAPA